MTTLGNGLHDAGHNEDALSVRETELAVLQRIGGPESTILVVQCNLAGTYGELGQLEKALSMERDVYSGKLKHFGEEHERTLRAASNYAASLFELKRFEDAKTLLRKRLPAARRVLGEDHRLTLKMRFSYARALYDDPGATLDDLREAVETCEDTDRIARRVLGGAHPLVEAMEIPLRFARAALRAREAPPSSA